MQNSTLYQVIFWLSGVTSQWVVPGCVITPPAFPVHSGLFLATLPDGSRAFAILKLKTEAKKVKNSKIKNYILGLS